MDHPADLIRTASGIVSSNTIENAVWELPEVSAAAAFGLAVEGTRGDVAAVAIELREGQQLDAEALARKVGDDLDASSRPLLVRIVASLPTTAGYRVLKSALRVEGLPGEDIAAGRVLAWNRKERRYETLGDSSAAGLREVLGAA